MKQKITGMNPKASCGILYPPLCGIVQLANSATLRFRNWSFNNKILKEERGVSFEEILDSTFLGAEKHRTRTNQMVLLYEYKKHVWVVPCVVEDKYIFLKTMFPSRKYTKIFKNQEGEK
jgi:hypothetical protein